MIKQTKFNANRIYLISTEAKNRQVASRIIRDLNLNAHGFTEHGMHNIIIIPETTHHYDNLIIKSGFEKKLQSFLHELKKRKRKVIFTSYNIISRTKHPSAYTKLEKESPGE